jgi:hypothetical protein
MIEALKQKVPTVKIVMGIASGTRLGCHEFRLNPRPAASPTRCVQTKVLSPSPCVAHRILLPIAQYAGRRCERLLSITSLTQVHSCLSGVEDSVLAQ